MKANVLLIIGVFSLGVVGFRESGEKEKSQAAKARIAALPRLSVETWKQLLTKHGWLYGTMSSKIKVIGLLTPKANISAKNMLFGSPMRDCDIVCKTIMVPDDSSPTWCLAAKLRIAYAITEPNKYKTPTIILNLSKQITEPKKGDFDSEWKALPEAIQKQATEEFESCRDLAKLVKPDTYFALLPNDEIVEVGHPFNVEKVWNDFLLAQTSN